MTPLAMKATGRRKAASRAASGKAGARRLPLPDGRVHVVPSLLAADHGRLAEAVASLEEAGADWFSLDVMDGHFVPNLSFGPGHVHALRHRTRKVLEAHLMVQDPVAFAGPFADAGADLLIGHVEACRPPDFIREARSRGVSAGLAVKPATPLSSLLPCLDDIDLALVMTVEPGFGGQAFLDDMLAKVRALREAIDRRGRKVWLMVDGGIGVETGRQAAAAGADALVAGSALFREPDPARAFAAIREAAQKAFLGGPPQPRGGFRR